MNPIAQILNRIAVLPAIARVRSEDAVRAALNGENGQVLARQEALLTRLEQLVSRLEATV